MRHKLMSAVLIAVCSYCSTGFNAIRAEEKPAAKPNIVIIDPEKAAADPDYMTQGEYAGEITDKDGNKAKTGLHVIAQGGGKFHAVVYTGGLPGDGYDRSKTKEEADGATAEGVTSFKHAKWDLKIKDGVATLSAEGKDLGQLKRVVRVSPTIGAKPPEGAVVLFDGTNIDEWQKGARMSEDKLLMQGANSVKKFTNFTLHVEFRLPYMPYARGQGRGNSGVYPQSRYETQVLDSFGLKGENNECGGIYTIAVPIVNMCYPPMQWQTYDMDYTAAQYEGDKKVKNARVTVKHNGVLIQNDTELTHATTSSPLKEGPEPGPLHLQNHGNEVRYRNVWLLEKK